jgi:hypothetical protein
MAICLAILLGPFLGRLVRKAHRELPDGLPLSIASRRAVQEKLNPDYATIAALSSFLSEPSARPGDIYVMGNPLIYLFGNRNQAVPILGWSLEMFLPDIWDDLHQQLAQKRPVYIFLDNTYQPLLQTRGARVQHLLQSRYDVLSVQATGTWYALR